MGIFLGVPIIGTIVFGGSILRSPYLGKLPYVYLYIDCTDYAEVIGWTYFGVSALSF